MIGILFSPASVRAIVERRKTVTRRIVGAEPCEYNVGDRLRVLEAWATSPEGAVRYSSTDVIPEGWTRHHGRAMPPEHARLTLEVVSGREEDLWDIGGADAYREGMLPTPERSIRGAFAAHWNTLHGAGAWDRNDRVRRIEFKIVEGP